VAYLKMSEPANNKIPGIDLLVVLLPISAALGTYAFPVRIGSVHLFGFRYLCILLFAMGIVRPWKLWWNSTVIQELFATGLRMDLLGLSWTILDSRHR